MHTLSSKITTNWPNAWVNGVELRVEWYADEDIQDIIAQQDGFRVVWGTETAHTSRSDLQPFFRRLDDAVSAAQQYLDLYEEAGQALEPPTIKGFILQ
ncbi:MAG TPA: hypothetical protein VKP88_02670 [Candidatus Paceibacterota bacterium]|nr:hypothetical protein [Candidatus Paceibacterota bacterium]